jgi:PAS domain S-box-containing protein
LTLRPQQIAAVVLVLGVTVAGFIGARALAHSDARHDSQHRVDVASAQIRSSVAEAASLTSSLQRYMLDAGGIGVTNDQFARTVLRWLTPAEFPAAAWVEQVRAAQRAAYERRTGLPIVRPGVRREEAPQRSSYLPATLVSGFRPMNVRGVDLNLERGIAAALAGAIRPGGVNATPVAPRSGGPGGLFLVAPAANLINGVLRPGAVVVFISERTLRAAANNAPGLRLAAAGEPSGPRGGGDVVRDEFTVAARRFALVMPREPVSGAGEVLPWLILAAGLVLAALAAALGVNAARRTKAQADLDRIFNLSPDLIAVADFEGHFTRVNPAVEQVLGFTEEEFLERPYLEHVHPEDRERTAAEASAIGGEGKLTRWFENRYARKDGSWRVLEWTSTPVVEDGLMYGMARDVTERREAEAEVERLAEEQAALRRAATLVAEDVAPSELFEAVAREVGRLLGADFSGMARFEGDDVVTVGVWAREGEHPTVPPRWPMQPGDPATTIAETRAAARWEDWSDVPGPIAEFIRDLGVRSTVGTPIVVEGRLWGALAAHSKRQAPFPADTEERMAQFTDLVGTAVANAEARANVTRLAEEQAALRRVATLIAREASQAEVFTGIAEAIGQLLGTDEIRMLRYEGDRSAVVVGSSGTGDVGSLGSREELVDGAAAQVLQTGRPARIDYNTASTPFAETVRSIGVRCVVGAPIVVVGRIWGAMVTARTDGEPLPPETEIRLGQFTDLMATAIANAESRAEVERLAQEQAALRRVATLAAEGAPPGAVLDAVVAEMEALLEADQVALNRFDPGDEISVLAHRGLDVERTPVGSRVSTEGESVTAKVRRTGKPARMEGYESARGAIAEVARATGLRSSVSAPIKVEGKLWGLITASWKGEASPPSDTEERMVKFAALLDTAIANAEARTQIERLAEEQSALRRVATLVAEGAAATAVFDAVAAEMARLLEVDGVTLSRYERDEHVTVIAHSGANAARVPAGTRVRHTGENVTSIVRRTKRPARLEHYEDATGPIADLVRDLGVRASVAAPIIVDGNLWGVTIANWQGEQSPPADTEERMTRFAELLDTAIANADSRDQLAASRARLVTAADEARRQVVRDLHDGAQQRLVHTIVSLKLAKRAFGAGDGKAEGLVREALQHAERSNAELRELAHGILPAILTRGGLRAGVDAVVSRLDLPVRVDVLPDRFPSEIEASAYFIVAEALTNVMKHSHATRAEVRASVQDRTLHVEVHDDGIGGADAGGHGLVGMADRVTALGGRLTVESPRGNGTLVAATLPLSSS